MTPAPAQPSPSRHEHARQVKPLVRTFPTFVAVGKLECNPSGQWLWLHHFANLPIPTALAELLTGAAP